MSLLANKAKLLSTDIADFSDSVAAIATSSLSGIVGAAPSYLDTLAELANAIGDDASFSTHVMLKTGATMTGELDLGNNTITSVSNLTTGGLTIGSTALTATATELNCTHGVVAGTSSAGKFVLVDSSNNIGGLGTVTATSLATTNLSLGGTAVTATAAQLNYLASVTAGIAANSKAIVLGSSGAVTGITSLSSATLAATQVNATTLTAGTANITSLVVGGNVVTSTGPELSILHNCSASTTDLNHLTAVTAGTAAANLALVLDSSKNIGTINTLTATNVAATNLSIGGTSVTSSAAELNYSHGVTLGTASASKVLTTDASLNVAGINSLSTSSLTLGGTAVSSTAAELNLLHGVSAGTALASHVMTTDSLNGHTTSGIIKAARFSASGDLRIAGSYPDLAFDQSAFTNFSLNLSNNFSGYVETLTPILTVAAAGITTAPNAAYSITHATNADGQHLTISNSGATDSLVQVQGNGTGSNGVLLSAPNSRVYLSGNTGIVNYSSNGVVQNQSPTQLSGLGVYASTGVLNGTVTTGVMNSLTSLTSIVEINSSGATLYSLPYTGTLMPYQQIIVFNKTASMITVGGNASTGAGYINGAYSYRLHPKRTVRFLYDAALTCWAMEDFLADCGFLNWKSHKWSSDEMLNLFVNPNYTYISKVKFFGSPVSINGVTGWSNVNATTYTFTNGAFTSATFTNLTYTGYALTSTESAKFVNGVQSTFAGVLTFTGLTKDAYYELCFYALDADGSSVWRDFKVVDNIMGTSAFLDTQLYTTNTTNSPGSIFSYIFRATFMSALATPAYSFTLSVNSSTIMNGMTLREIGASL